MDLLPVSAKYYFTQAHIPRALEAEQVQQLATSKGLNGNIFENVNLALRAAMQHASPNDLILVCGSVFLVGEVESL